MSVNNNEFREFLKNHINTDINENKKNDNNNKNNGIKDDVKNVYEFIKNHVHLRSDLKAGAISTISLAPFLYSTPIVIPFLFLSTALSNEIRYINI